MRIPFFALFEFCQPLRKPATLLSLSFLLIVLISGCAGKLKTTEPEIERAENSSNIQKPEDVKTTKVRVEELDRSRKAAYSDIEVLWAIPEKPVEGFVLHYGFARTELDQSMKLYSQDIERYEDKIHGSVYRHYLRSLPQDQDVFVSITAFDGPNESEPTEPFKVEAAD